MRRWIVCSVALAALAVPLAWAAAAEPAEEAAADAGKPAPSSSSGQRLSAAERAAHEMLKTIRLIEIRQLRSQSRAEFQKGRDQVLALKDEAAVGPLVQVLYGPNERYRALLVEALRQHATAGSEAAKAYLQEVAVGDGSRANRRLAVEAIRTSTDSDQKTPTERLMAHLALDEVPVLRERAASALADLQEKRAVWLLVERLVTEEYRLAGAWVTDWSMQFDIRAQWAGVPEFRQTTVSAVVPGAPPATTTIDLPIVQVVDVATTVAMMDRTVEPDYKRVEVQHPGILAALRRLTGKDFGYDQAAWQKWLQSNPKEIPPWEPIRFSTEGSAAKGPK